MTTKECCVVIPIYKACPENRYVPVIPVTYCHFLEKTRLEMIKRYKGMKKTKTYLAGKFVLAIPKLLKRILKACLAHRQ
jgi:hypothetical protein